VSPDARFSFGGVLYSVDPGAAGHTVTIRSASDEPGSEISASLGDQLVAAHARRPGSQPHFVQDLAPVVEVRPLSVYDTAAVESVA
jgi:hypothetical protein